MTSDERAAIVNRVFTAHVTDEAAPVSPTTAFAIASDVRTAFEAAGATWEEIARFAAKCLDEFGRDSQLTDDQFRAVRTAFCDGYRVDVEVTDASRDRLRVNYAVTDRPSH